MPGIIRKLLYGLGGGVASVGLWANVAVAAETSPITYGPSDVAWGRTLTLDDGAKAGIFPDGLVAPGEVTWTVHEGIKPDLPPHRAVLGRVYRLSIDGQTMINSNIPRPLAIAIPDSSSYWIRQIWVYDLDAKIWNPLTTRFSTSLQQARASSGIQRGLYAILEDRRQQEGIASWYCRYHCSSRYPELHAASNDYPVGSMVTVRSLENGRTVNVKIISRWGQPEGRVIDLSYAAFAALRASNGGLTKVNVSPLNPKPAQVAQSSGQTSGSTYDRVETIPSLSLHGDNLPPPAEVQAVAFSVYDQTTGKFLGARNGNTVRPIASITKLVSVMVFLDTQTSLKKVVTYKAEDNAVCSCLSISPGETLTVRDLFYTALVGSANNATNALARSTGLSRAEFVDRMNAKAAELGLTKTHFVDPTGLSPNNVSTANEVAKMTAHALHHYEPIRYVTTRRSYDFTTINSGRFHHIVLRYSIYSRSMPLPGLTVTGGKTGYLDESWATYALRVKNLAGAQVVFVTLGSPPFNTYVQRLNDQIALINWAYGHHVWE